jgi:hypothetical protein
MPMRRSEIARPRVASGPAVMSTAVAGLASAAARAAITAPPMELCADYTLAVREGTTL